MCGTYSGEARSPGADARRYTACLTTRGSTASEPTRFTSAREFEAWLEEHHDASPGIWLEFAKKGASLTTPTYAEALDVALCFGWIDAQKKGKDERTWLQRFTPRTRSSKWSRINRDKADALIAAKKMRPAGRAQVDAAKKDGRWEQAYHGQKTATVPPDLAKALAKNARARRFFDDLDSANRYAILYRLHHTKKPELRAKKVDAFVAMLAEGRKIHETPRRSGGRSR